MFAMSATTIPLGRVPLLQAVDADSSEPGRIRSTELAPTAPPVCLPNRKGVLFIATFRWREFQRAEKRNIYTKSEYFIILYRYYSGRFLRIGQMETNFNHGGYLSHPFFKDINVFVSGFHKAI